MTKNKYPKINKQFGNRIAIAELYDVSEFYKDNHYRIASTYTVCYFSLMHDFKFNSKTVKFTYLPISGIRTILN